MDKDTKGIEFVWDNRDPKNTFSLNRPNPPVSLPVKSNRLDTGIYLASPRITELTSQHKNAILIFNLLRLFLTTVHFHKIKENSKQSYLNAIHHFVTWLNTKSSISNKIVKEYESEKVRSRKIKPESTGAAEILFCLKQGVTKSSIVGSDLKFINQLINKSKLVSNRNEATKQATLTNYFLEHPWVENKIGNHQFLKLASPKRLIRSFRVVIAETLSYLRHSKDGIRLNLELQSLAKRAEISHDDKKRLIAHLLNTGVHLNELGIPMDSVSNILLIESVNQKNEVQVISSLNKEKAIRSNAIVTTQVFISDVFEKRISKVEGYLMAFLCASHCVQPEDILKLKKKHFAIAKNGRNEPRHLSISYFKGRSEGYHDTPILSIRHPVGRAMYQYLQDTPDNEDALFPEKLTRTKFSAYSIHTKSCDNSISNFLVRLWKSKHFRGHVMKSIEAEGVSTLFLDCMSALSSPDAVPYYAWKRKRDGDYEEYLNTTTLTRPVYLFWLAHIKNSAVHSNADKFRSGDIKNYNSHTSLTEKTSYLGEDNQEFMNQAGRISRAVLQHMEDSIYVPNLEQIEQEVKDKNIRSHLIDITQNQDLTINPLSLNRERIAEATLDFDDLTIIESKETVVQMLHYIAQADKYSKQLIKKNPNFFYMSVLIKVEWSKYVLSELFDPKSEAFLQGTKTYEKIKTHLPELFTSELNGGIG